MLLPPLKSGGLSGTYVLEERSNKFYNMVSVGSPHALSRLAERKKRGRRDRIKHTELSSLANLDALLARSRDSDPEPPAEEVHVRLPPIDNARVSICNFKRLLGQSAASVEACQAPSEWHLFLLRASYDGAIEAKTVAGWLAEVLCVSIEEANISAEAAAVYPTVHLASFNNWQEVQEKAESLRSLGLAVQVGSMRPSMVSPRSDSRGRPARDNYLELFESVPGHRPLRRAPPSRSNAHRKKWRGMSQHVVMDVIAKDPVQALFTKEAGLCASESDAKWNHLKIAKARKRRMDQLLSISKTDKVEVLDTKEKPQLRKSESKKESAERGVLSSVSQNQVLSQQRKEACQMMRFFVYGCVGNENAKTQKEKDQIFSEALGSWAQVQTLYILWSKLDDDNSGRVDFAEFRGFAEARMMELVQAALDSESQTLARLPSWAVVQTQEDVNKSTSKFIKILEQILLGVKSSFVLEDMMRIIWPMSQHNHLTEMRRWCTEISSALDRTVVKTPPLLPEEQLEDLQCVFQYFDLDRDGHLKVSELLASGFLNQQEAQSLIEKYDADEDEQLNMAEFTEMLCPLGFRVREEASHATLDDGRNVWFDADVQRWRLAEEA
ncbi:unnamed protein product [Effrenium voratum]|nr:unnamed protein product [Effrenium voratum]CAJ1421918.1 unnamed protein product [Effrenium voratum]|mmetsp:Transcript_32882/g.78734  ORF Transcript_32882/g.78734 Transcript_32882/m.78734 type:complete len:609 (-) Transcript_32882:230-2056(-)